MSVTSEKFQEILKLETMLIKSGIPYEMCRYADGWKLYYPTKENRACDVTEMSGSYGYQDDLMEMSGNLTKPYVGGIGLIGHLDAKWAFNRIKHDYDKRVKQSARNYF